MGAASAALYVGTFAIQTMMVFASNSRLFGLLPEGSGWRTNVEMSILYTSLVTPANWAFAIWGIIYTAGMLLLSLSSFRVAALTQQRSHTRC